MRELAGFGWVVTILHYDESGSLEGASNAARVGHGREWVCAHDPDRLYLAAFERLKHAHGIETRLRLDAISGHAPDARNLLAMLRIGDITITGQLASEITNFATTHRIRLASERKWAATRATNFSRREMKIDDGEILGDAAGALINPHGPETQRLGGLAKPKGCAVNVRFGNAANLCRARRRPGFRQFIDLLPIFGVRTNEPFVEPALRNEHMQYR